MKSTIRLLGISLLLGTSIVLAQDTRTFNGGAPSPYNTNWERGDNWNAGSVPEITSTAYIPYGTPYVAVTGTDCRAGRLTIQKGGRLIIKKSDNGKRLTVANDLVVEEGGTLNITGSSGDNGPVISVGGNIENNGTFDLQGVSLANAGVVLDGTTSQTIRGTQAIALANLSSNHSFTVDGVTVFVTGQFKVPTGLPVEEINGGRLLVGVTPFRILAESGLHGAISSAGSNLVVPGEPMSFTFTPSPSYRVDSVYVDGGYVGSPGTYTFPALAAHHTIRVVFAYSDVAVEPGWNLISVSRFVPDFSANALLPGRLDGPLAFDSDVQDFALVSMLENGSGYFVLYADSRVVSFSGGSVDSIAVLAPRAGWVLIGSLSDPVPASSIRTVEPGALIDGPLGYNVQTRDFERSSMLEPGKGYFLLVSQPCTILVKAP